MNREKEEAEENYQRHRIDVPVLVIPPIVWRDTDKRFPVFLMGDYRNSIAVGTILV